MSVRTGFIAVSLVSVVVCAAACSESARSITEPSSSPPRATELSELATPGTVVSWLRLLPEQGAAGSVVSVDVACLDNLGAVNSPVLDIGPLKGNPDGHQPWRLFGSATVRPDAAPGRYWTSATCGASELSTGFTVVPPPPR